MKRIFAVFIFALSAAFLPGASSINSYRVGVSAPYTPQSAAGLLVWWNAPFLALSNGASITSWTDKKTGGTGALTLFGADTSPTYNTAVQNGQAAATFNGVDNTMSATNVSSSTYPRVLWAVVKYNSTGGTFQTILGSSDGANQGNGGLHWYVETSSGFMSVTSQNTAAIGTATTSLTANAWHMIQCTVTSTTWAFKIDGVAAGSGSHSVSLTGGRNFSLGGIHQGSSVPAVVAKVIVGDVAVFSSLSGGDDSGLLSYSQTTWATP
jgi:hypothetical protein